MFIGHLPIGYLVSNVIYARLKSSGIGARGVMISAMFGSIFPDLDLLYFYLIDNRQHNHHSYWTHYPSVWFCLILFSLILCYLKRARAFAMLMLIFSLNGMIHMILDSVAGAIYWFAPFKLNAYSLVAVPALYEPWWLNFILHWTFVVEMVITVWVIIFVRYIWRNRLAGVCTVTNQHSQAGPR